MNSEGIVGRLAKFAYALRGKGVRVALGDEIDAGEALMLVDLLDSAEVHRTLRIALKVRPEDWEVFDRLFNEIFTGEKQARHAHPPLRDHRGPAQWMWDGERVRLELAGSDPHAVNGLSAALPGQLGWQGSMNQTLVGEPDGLAA